MRTTRAFCGVPLPPCEFSDDNGLGCKCSPETEELIPSWMTKVMIGKKKEEEDKDKVSLRRETTLRPLRLSTSIEHFEDTGNLKNAVIYFLVPLPSIFFHLSFLRHYRLGDSLSSPPPSDGLARSAVAVVLTWVWSISLTHNHFRTERWQFGAKEDWRFNDMRKEYGRPWWWISFFAVYVSQQILLIGICLPMYAIHSSDKPSNIWHFAATIGCITGIVVAYFADTQLHEFVSRNETLSKSGEPMVPRALALLSPSKLFWRTALVKEMHQEFYHPIDLIAGITVYSPMIRYKMNQPAGTSLGVISLGGLGHMAVKFGKAFGLKVTTFSTGDSKKEEALHLLGADNFVVLSNKEQIMLVLACTQSGDHPFDPYMALLKHGGVDPCRISK
ncbi:hypothetical protein Cni_G14883 [Canna indica]|uniref:Alcohol dehydrogenase-like C-terminal domain-containing protein n=1 Tax=Canna indica TaxID=4628 RepID=A0AAQ3QE85_9LILI|nr:hypothetical protein Cni_G14883 [Canna indica]